MHETLGPTEGMGVLHLFGKFPKDTGADTLVSVVEKAKADGIQVVPVAMLGHRFDIGLMALADDLWRLRRFQSGAASSGLELTESYFSLTEVSEYASGVPDEMKQARLYPQLPPDGKRAFCFYPMSKKREAHANWFSLPYEERDILMRGHGKTGRNFAGRILQVVTGSAGLDDYEWGVTLFGVSPSDIKDCVYQMRFDEASALYADFGPFYSGIVGEIAEVVEGVLTNG